MNNRYIIDIVAVSHPDEIETVALMAEDIWNEHYADIIGKCQVDYMVEKFQSAHAITRQIAEGYEYSIVMIDNAPAGYFAIVPDQNGFTTQVSKIYLKKDRRGSGTGRLIMGSIEKRSSDLGISSLWLTVNRNNKDSIAFYQKMGFTISRSIVIDIGGGFVMDDYKMTKMITGHKREADNDQQ